MSEDLPLLSPFEWTKTSLLCAIFDWLSIAAYSSEIHSLCPSKSFRFTPERNCSQVTNASQWFSSQGRVVLQDLKLPFG